MSVKRFIMKIVPGARTMGEPEFFYIEDHTHLLGAPTWIWFPTKQERYPPVMVVGVTNPDNPSNVIERNNIKKPGQFLGKYVWVSKTGKWDSGRLRIGPISEIIELAEGTVNI